MEDDFPVQRGDFQVNYVSFLGSSKFCFFRLSKVLMASKDRSRMSNTCAICSKMGAFSQGSSVKSKASSQCCKASAEGRCIQRLTDKIQESGNAHEISKFTMSESVGLDWWFGCSIVTYPYIFDHFEKSHLCFLAKNRI